MAAHASIVRSLYRASLRAATRLHAASTHAVCSLDDFDAAPLQAGIASAAPSASSESLSPRAVRQHIRDAFKSNAGAAPQTAHVLIDAALTALQEANVRAHAVETSQHRGRPSSVRHRVGEVVQVQRGDGVCTRAVVVGYDASCAASSAWMTRTGVAALPHGATQAFYHVLTHAYEPHATAHVEYVPQDALRTVHTADAAARFVLHPLLHHYFTRFNLETGEYTPTHALACLYPDASGEWSARAMIEQAARGVRVQLSKVHVVAHEDVHADDGTYTPHVRTPADAGALM